MTSSTASMLCTGRWYTVVPSTALYFTVFFACMRFSGWYRLPEPFSGEAFITVTGMYPDTSLAVKLPSSALYLMAMYAPTVL